MDILKRGLFCLVSLVVAACGASFSLDPARFVLSDGEGLSREKVLLVVSPFLARHGFEDLGIDQEMIDLVERSPVKDESHLADLRNRLTYLNRDKNLRVMVTDYSDPSRRRPMLAYQAPAGPFFELSVYEERPGGFSPDGHRFVSALHEELRHALTTTMVTPPPATDQSVYWRTTAINGLGLAVQWALAFSIAVAATGTMTLYVLRRLPLRRTTKQGLFVLINTWLATPLPFQAATILVVLLPNLFAFPWTYADYSRRVQDVAVVSFPISLTLCFLISLWLFPKFKGEGGDT